MSDRKDLPPPNFSLMGSIQRGSQDKVTSIDGGGFRPPIAVEVRLLRERFPEVVGFIEREGRDSALMEVRTAVLAMSDGSKSGSGGYAGGFDDARYAVINIISKVELGDL